MDGVASVVAVGLAGVFVVAAVLKLRDHTSTTSEFASLGLPRARSLAVVVPLVELLVAAGVVLRPAWGGVAAFVLLAAFTTLLAGIVRSGRVVSCACFGGARTEPVDGGHLARNALLMGWALVALTIEQLRRPSTAEVVVAIVVLVVPFLALDRWRRSRRSA